MAPDPLPAIWQGARRAGRLVLDALLPPHCLTCDTPVDAPGQFCPTCFAETRFISAPCCDRCGVPFSRAGADASPVCNTCLAAPPPWGRARAAMAYDAQSRRVVLPFKHADRPELAAALAALMARAGAALLRDATLLVPVPLHRLRLLGRRYNQSALMAGRLSRIAAIPHLPDALQRTRATAPLGDLSAEQRAAMVKDAITARQHRRAAIAGQHVLLIDDVLTSGATAGACTRALLAAGAATVDVLVAARVPAPGRRD